MAEEEYYYEDDGYAYDDDGQGEQEETWETLVENKYASAKSCIDTEPARAIREFEEVIADDVAKGKWTFKALKMLARTCQRSRRYPEMVSYYERAIGHSFPERSRTDTEKAVTKFLERCAAVPHEILARIYDLTVAALEKDLRTFEKLWFSVGMKHVDLLLQQHQWQAACDRIGPLKQWCLSGDSSATQRKASQLLHVYAAEIQVYSERQDNTKLRDLYTQSVLAMEHALAPPKVCGTIRECGGKMFMRQGLWQEAHDAFGQAFRCFDDAGDPRRVSNLKYLVLSSMLSSTKIDPFASNETKSFQNDREIVCMTELIKACQNCDIHAFDRVLKDKHSSQAILSDPFIFRFLQPLIRRVRLQVLQQFVKPYRRLRLSKIASELSVDGAEAERLCVALILEGTLKGARVDQAQGLLLLGLGESAAEQDSALEALEAWGTALEKRTAEFAALALRAR